MLATWEGTSVQFEWGTDSDTITSHDGTPDGARAQPVRMVLEIMSFKFSEPQYSEMVILKARQT